MLKLGCFRLAFTIMSRLKFQQGFWKAQTAYVFIHLYSVKWTCCRSVARFPRFRYLSRISYESLEFLLWYWQIFYDSDIVSYWDMNLEDGHHKNADIFCPSRSKKTQSMCKLKHFIIQKIKDHHKPNNNNNNKNDNKNNNN